MGPGTALCPFRDRLAMIPNRLVVSAYWGRSTRLWFITRVALSVVFLLGGENPLQLSILAIIAIATLASGLGLVDLRRHREQSLLGNLGVSQTFQAMLVCIPSIVGEGLLLVAGRAF